MAIAFGAAGTILNQSSSTSWAVPYPATVNEDDLLVLFMSTKGQAVDTPTGWTQVYQETTVSNPKGGIWIKVADGTESGNLSVSLPSAGVGSAIIVSYTGVDPTTPQDATATSVSSTSNTTVIVNPSITIATDGAWLVYCGTANSFSVTGTGQTGSTERADFGDGSGDTNSQKSGALYDDGPEGTGASGTRTVTLSASRAGWGAMLALRPATSSPITAEPTGIASAEILGSTTAILTITLSATGIASAEALGTPTINSTITLSPTGISTGEVLGSPTHSGTITLSPSGIATGEALGTPSYGEAITLSPTGIASAEALGNPTHSGAITVSPSSIASGEAMGTPEIIEEMFLNPVGIASAETMGSVSALLTIMLSPVGIASAEAVGSPTVSFATVMVPTSIVSEETIGVPTANLSITLSPTGIPSEEAMGTPVIPSYPTGIASEESLGTPSVTLVVIATPTGIPSGEAMGLPRHIDDSGVFTLERPLDTYTYADLEYEFYSRQSGLASGTINDHKVAFYKNVLGIEGHFDDLEYAYFKLLSGLIGDYSLADHKTKTIEATTIGEFNDTLKSYYSQFFEGA